MPAKRRRTRRGRPPHPAPKALPDDLYDYDDTHNPMGGTRRCNTPLRDADGQTMHVTDDWPEHVPVTEAEIQVFERWFGDVFDDLLNPRKSEDGLSFLS